MAQAGTDKADFSVFQNCIFCFCHSVESGWGFWHVYKYMYVNMLLTLGKTQNVNKYIVKEKQETSHLHFNQMQLRFPEGVFDSLVIKMYTGMENCSHSGNNSKK